MIVVIINISVYEYNTNGSLEKMLIPYINKIKFMLLGALNFVRMKTIERMTSEKNKVMPTYT